MHGADAHGAAHDAHGAEHDAHGAEHHSDIPHLSSFVIWIADFIGEANILPCEITAISGDMADIAMNGYRYSLPSRGLPSSTSSTST